MESSVLGDCDGVGIHGTATGAPSDQQKQGGLPLSGSCTDGVQGGQSRYNRQRSPQGPQMNRTDPLTGLWGDPGLHLPRRHAEPRPWPCLRHQTHPQGAHRVHARLVNVAQHNGPATASCRCGAAISVCNISLAMHLCSKGQRHPCGCSKELSAGMPCGCSDLGGVPFTAWPCRQRG